MNIPPFLTSSSRIILQAYGTNMVDGRHVSWLNDPEVVRYSEQRHKRHTMESVRAYVNGMANNPDGYLWRIVTDEHHEAAVPIGTISAYVDRPNGVANVGIMLGDKTKRGRGYATEAWNMVCNWLFQEQNIRKIEMGCHYENRDMRNLAERCGMTMEGVRHDHFVVEGKPQHLLLYAKMRPAEARVTVNEGDASKSLRALDS